MKRRIQRPFLHSEKVIRCLLYVSGDRIAVQSASSRKSLENQKINRTLQVIAS